MTQSNALIALYLGPSPIVDIVAVHGLYGDALRSWTSKKSEKIWLSDPTMLPATVPNIRVLSWSYNADVTAFLGNTSAQRILGHAQTLVASLQADREIEGATTRPIIFVCHSLGGIIVKRALAYSASRTSKDQDHLYSIYVSTYGILFFGTPHHGSNIAKMAGIARRVMGAVVPKRIMDTNGQLLDALQENSETLQNITDQFVPLMSRFRIFFFWEQEKTHLAHTKDYLVDEASAAPILNGTDRSGVGASHSQMCKFDNPSSGAYRTALAAIMRYVRSAPATIDARIVQAEEMLKRLRSQEAQEFTAGL